MKKKCVLVFLKSPVMGNVKTRLAEKIGNMQAVHLYKYFVYDTLKMLENGIHSIIICYYPFDAEKDILKWLGNKYPLRPQKGDTLGKKMSNAFEQAFEQGFDHVLLMGTDIPDLPGAIITKGFDELNHNDAVIGPSTDGGYYIIGFNARTFYPQAFENITWSTEKVFQETLNILRQNKKSIYILPEWRDIDIFEDLIEFINSNTETNSKPTQTFTYLSSLKMITDHL